MSEAVAAWIQGQGFDVYTEVPAPFSASRIDLVGWRQSDDAILCVEMKMTLSEKVRRQARYHQSHTRLVYVAVRSSPTAVSIEACRKIGIGILRVTEIVEVLLAPEAPRDAWDPYAKHLKRYLQAMDPGGVGGMPNLKGEGPAQDCWLRVQEYRQRFPKATWKEVFHNVPNYYANAGSLCSGMRMVEQRRMWRQSRKEAQQT